MLLNKGLTIKAILLFSVTFFVFGSLTALAEHENNNHTPGPPEFVEDEILVKFKKNVDEATINDINKAHGTSVKSNRLVAGYMQLQVHGNEVSIRRLVALYKKLDEVEFAEPNYIVSIATIPNDANFSNLWGLHNTGQSGGTNDADIDMVETWDIMTDSSSVICAIIDTGVDYNHEDLAANMWKNPGEIAGNGIDDDGNGFIDDVMGWDFANNDNDPFDDNSHGTHVAGTIGAVGNNSIGVAGVSWNSKIMALKFLKGSGSGSTSDAISAIEYATMMGAKITNNSWGGGGFSQALKDAITAADAAGVLFVAAAGNNGTNNDSSPHYPSSYDLPNIISVAATDSNDNLASFSNFGVSSVDIAAPGVSIYSSTPNNGYSSKSGTSMATPHVAGAATLMMAQFPALTNIEIKERMFSTVDAIASLNGIVTTNGRLNVNNAIMDTTPPPPPPQDLVVIFEDNMENGINGWSVSGSTSLWHQSFNRSNSPITSWYYGDETTFTYDIGQQNSGSLISPPIDLSDVSNATLKFSHFLETEVYNGFDTAIVSISNDEGLTYTNVFSRLSTNGLTINESINISLYDGSIITVKFSFDTVDNILNNFEGWYVDDVKIEGAISEVSPVADAGLDQTVIDFDDNGIETLTLNGSGSFDPDGTIVSYEWKENGTVLGNTATTTYDFTVGSHEVSLTVADDMGFTNTDFVTVTVNANIPPTANAGTDQIVNDVDGNGFEAVTLNGSESFDPDGTIISYEWKEGTTVLGTDPIITHDFDVGVFTVTLTVIDNLDFMATDDVIITVNANQKPVAIAGDDQTLEDSDGNGLETATLTASASFDNDGSIIAYEWREADILLGTDVTIATDFTIGLHNVTLTVFDDGDLSDSDALLITVNEAPSVGPIILVANIDINLSKKGPKYSARATVTIADDNGKTISGASVNGGFDLNDNIIKLPTKNSNKKGLTSFDSGGVVANTGDVITFTITNISKSGFTYDAASNIETCDFVTIP